MCHGSVGLVARALEAHGIATVSVGVRAFEHTLVGIGAPRMLITPHPMGRTIGPAGDADRQRDVVVAALDLLADAKEPGTLIRMGTSPTRATA